MIQNIAPSVFHNEYMPVPAKPQDVVFVFAGKTVLAKTDLSGSESVEGETCFPVAEDYLGKEEDLQFLFRIDERSYFLYFPRIGAAEADAGDNSGTSSAQAEFKPGFDFRNLMAIRQDAAMTDMFAAMTAFHLFTWYDKARFCGRCGAPLEHDRKERMLRCPDCGNMVFPVIAPAVIVGVTDSDRLLMTKYAGREYTGWALIAGFCEIGETVGDTVRREVLEEAGVHVKHLRYVASQPWGSDSNLLMGVFCEVDGDREIHMDRQELSRAVWVDRADVPEMKDNHSLTGYMIEMFRTGHESDFLAD